MNKIKYFLGVFLLMSIFACNDTPTVAEKQAAELVELESFIAKNYPDATKTESGLYIIWRQKGTGAQVNYGDYVSVNYVGTFLDGTIFDASEDHGGTFQFYVGAQQVISAWDEALQLCKIGDKVTIIAPSTLAYGNYGSGTIPGYTSLVFDIDVIEIFNK